jgi:8-oxo-dGTP diphosphatase
MTQSIHKYAGVLLISTHGELIAQKRDDIPHIDNPGKVSAFGGTMEENETPLDAVVRELGEETNLKVESQDLKPFTDYKAWREMTQETEMIYYYIFKDIEVNNLKIYEGEGYYIVKSPDDPLLTDNFRPAVKKWFEVQP